MGVFGKLANVWQGGVFGDGDGGGAPFQSGFGDEGGYAMNAFKKFFGREATAAELAQVIPAYLGADQHTPNIAQGDAFVANLFQAQENTPEKLNAKQQAKYKEDAPKFYDEINQQFQGILGREASQNEKDHFGSLMASGNVDGYTIGQFLTTLPENVKKQDEAFRTEFNATQQKQDAQYYNEQVMPAISANYAKTGRSFDSSGYATALAQAAQGQNRQREGFLSTLTAQQYGGNQANARNDYLNAYGNYQGLQNSGINAQYTGLNNAMTRSNEFSDFNTQQQAYAQYLQRYGKRNSGLGGLLGGLAGAGAGAFYGGPDGAAVGWQMGQGVGNSFGGGNY